MRSSDLVDVSAPRLAARDRLFMGGTCTEGEARGVLSAAMRTELGRIAALSERLEVERSRLERQVRRVAWLIAGVAVAMAIGFVPFAVLAAGLSAKNAVVFAVGLLAGNVPEGLLPVITFALAAAVRTLAGGVILFAGAFMSLPPLQSLCGTAALPARDTLFLLPDPFIVWGADELRRWAIRRLRSSTQGVRCGAKATYDSIGRACPSRTIRS
jgi:hypothetical protein